MFAYYAKTNILSKHKVPSSIQLTKKQLDNYPYIKSYNNKKKQLKNLYTENRYKYIMLGDSLTAGADWKKFLQRTDVLNMGVGGDMTFLQINGKKYGVLNRLHGLNNKYKIIFIMIGINDLMFGKDPTTVFNAYKKIIIKIQSNNITPIIQSTLYITDNKYGINKKTVNKKVSQLNKLLKNFADKNNILYIDINSEVQTNDEELNKTLTSDGIHLNKLGYIKWVNKIKRHFK